MDLDAILFLIEKLKTGKVTQNELLIIASCITNCCIDINRSLNELLFLIGTQDEDDLAFDMIESNNLLYTEPLYMILYRDEIFRPIIISSLRKRRLLTDDSYINFLGTLLDMALELEEDEAEKVLFFVMELISLRGKEEVGVLQNSSRLRRFVKDNLDSLTNGVSREMYRKEQLKRLIIIKLFTNGFVLYGDYFDISISYEDILIPLIKTKSYGHLRLVLNTSVVPVDDLDYVLNLVISLIQEYQDDVTLEDREIARAAINELGLYIDSLKKSNSY